MYGFRGVRIVIVTYLCASIFVDASQDVPLALDRAQTGVSAGAKLLEWRLDALAEEDTGLASIRELLEQTPATAIATIRAESEGGTWAGEDADRISLLEAIGTGPHPPRYIDLELGAWNRSANLRQKVMLAIDHEGQVRDVETKLILSSHEFSGRPTDLMHRVAQMIECDQCAIAKIVWRARSLRDNLEAFDLLASRAKPMIALCMGEFGLMSRVLAPKFGGFLTFAAVEEGGGTAPGQPTVHELRSTYRFDSINHDTKVYGVVGWPVEHSKGPEFHNAGFDAVDFNGVYIPLPIMPEWEQFKASMTAMIDHPNLDFRGCSVTLPHKENLLRLVRERGGHVDEHANRIGAANTLVIDDEGKLTCLNTDAPAAVEALCDGMSVDVSELRGRTILILGAGGVARAIASGVLECGADVLVHNRTSARADALVTDLRSDELDIRAVAASELDQFHIDVIINCTSVGMEGGPAPEESPVPKEVVMTENTVIFETVYAPAETPFIREAYSCGAKVITGEDLFVRQAKMQFQTWTGSDVSIDFPKDKAH